MAHLLRSYSGIHHGVHNELQESEVAAATLLYSEFYKQFQQQQHQQQPGLRQHQQHLLCDGKSPSSASGARSLRCGGTSQSTTAASSSAELYAVCASASATAAAAASAAEGRFGGPSCKKYLKPQPYFDPCRGKIDDGEPDKRCYSNNMLSAPSADASSSSSSPLSHEMPSSTSKTWMPIISNEYFVMEEETSGSETEYTSEEEEDELEMLDLWGENEVLSSIDEMNAYDQWLLSDPGLVAAVCRPRVFNEASSMAFYMTPLAMATMVQALLGRHASACVHMNLRIPREYLFDDMDWSSDALRMLYLPNAGGSSHLSEVLSFEILHRCLGAQLAETEMEIRYFFAYQPITDYTVTVPSLAGVVGYGPGRMHGHQGPVKLGVSVTRAFSFRGPYRRSDCRKLLRKKLRGIIESSKNVVGGKLYKQILHVLVPSGKVARTVYSTWKRMPAELVHNTVVVVSIVNAPWVFTNRR
ncbi:hypothetical protein BGZ73_008077 [Actinomortierella ambigua]|nr:hypothetical protein BGZ73_008077 [Actinomortierella ambigua]